MLQQISHSLFSLLVFFILSEVNCNSPLITFLRFFLFFCKYLIVFLYLIIHISWNHDSIFLLFILVKFSTLLFSNITFGWLVGWFLHLFSSLACFCMLLHNYYYILCVWWVSCASWKPCRQYLPRSFSLIPLLSMFNQFWYHGYSYCSSISIPSLWHNPCFFHCSLCFLFRYSTTIFSTRFILLIS